METKGKKIKKQLGPWRENLLGHILKKKVDTRWEKKNKNKTKQHIKSKSRGPNQEHLKNTEGEGVLIKAAGTKH